MRAHRWADGSGMRICGEGSGDRRCSQRARHLSRWAGRVWALLLAAGVASSLLLPEAAAQSPNSGSGSIVVVGSVQALRIGVVDQNGLIIQVWSNTGVPAMPPQWRLLRVNGPVVEATDAIRVQFQAIQGRIDWSKRGL